MKNHIIIFCAKYVVFIIALLALGYWATLNKKKKVRLAVTVIIGLVAAVIIAKIASKLYYDPRPFVKQNLTPLFTHSPDNGFPSDHTYLAMTIATSVYFYRRKLGAVLFVLTLIVGVARVLAHVHSPIDIIGALVIGAIAGSIGFYLTNLVAKKYLAKKS